jgi:hypothetical protein
VLRRDGGGEPWSWTALRQEAEGIACRAAPTADWSAAGRRMQVSGGEGRKQRSCRRESRRAGAGAGGEGEARGLCAIEIGAQISHSFSATRFSIRTSPLRPPELTAAFRGTIATCVALLTGCTRLHKTYARRAVDRRAVETR